jgi:hypothetical protein
LISAREWARVPSAEKSNDPDGFLGSGSVASSLALGVQEIHLLDDEADSIACAVILAFLVRLVYIY